MAIEGQIKTKINQQLQTQLLSLIDSDPTPVQPKWLWDDGSYMLWDDNSYMLLNKDI